MRTTFIKKIKKNCGTEHLYKKLISVDINQGGEALSILKYYSDFTENIHRILKILFSTQNIHRILKVFIEYSKYSSVFNFFCKELKISLSIHLGRKKFFHEKQLIMTLTNTILGFFCILSNLNSEKLL